jgi:hypothetical protein
MEKELHLHLVFHLANNNNNYSQDDEKQNLRLKDYSGIIIQWLYSLEHLQSQHLKPTER